MFTKAMKFKIFFNGFLFLLCVSTPVLSNAAGACSPYIGQATLNEFFKDRANQSNDPDDFAEVKILNDSILQATYNNWTIKICEQSVAASNNDEDGCSLDIPLSSFTDTLKPWLVLKGVVSGKHINLKTGFDATLLDSNGDLIDYITVDGYSDAITGITCNLSNLLFDYTASSPGASDKTIFRSPDGTGIWDSAPSATAPPTEDTTNDNLPPPPAGQTYPYVTINNVSLSTGGTALFTVSLTDATGTLTTFSQAVTVSYYTQDGTATVADSDYTAVPIATPSTVTISAGQSTATISIASPSSNDADSDEYFYAVLQAVLDSAANSGTPNATISKHFGTATLNGPVAEWNFDNCNISSPNDITDSSGNNLHATPFNGITTAAGKICTALSLDGSNDYAEVADNAALDISQNLTVMAWIHPDALPSSGLMTILSKDENYEFHINTAGNINWWWNNSSGGTRQFFSTVPVAVNTWTHIAIVYEPGSQRIVINGVERGTTAYNETLITNNDPLHIGGDQLFAGRFFDGLIDEVKVYRRALSTAEINSYYTNPDPLNRICPTCTPVASQTIILSTDNSETLGGLSFSDGSLAEYDPAATSSTLYFNENLFSGGADIDAVHVLANGIIILSTMDDETLGGLSFGDDDLIAYDPATNTATLYFDGGALFSNTSEDIDAVYIRDNGNIILSTNGDATLGGISFVDGDLVEYDPSTNTATLFFDESNFSGGADIDGVHILSNGNILISTDNGETLGGLSFSDGSIAEYNPGINTATLYFDENLFSGGADINALTLPPITTALHHILITHDGTALTCEPESITVTACANAACTTPHYASDVSVTLTPSDANSTWIGGNPKIISGGSSVFQLRTTSVGPVTLSASASSPTTSITPSPSVSCINSSILGSTSCDLEFYNSGFIYTVPTQTSCATSNNIAVQAVRLDATTQTCVPAFQNVNRNLKVWASYTDPAPTAITGSPTVTLINDLGSNLLPSNEPASVNVNMSFAGSADDSFTVTYPDAGQLTLNMKYEGSIANSDSGLTMLGNNTFVVKPAKFYVYSDDTNSSCPSADPILPDCDTAFRKTGENFNLKVRAACADNTVTPNFKLNGIFINSNLIAPSGGTTLNANIAVTSVDITTNGEAVISNQNVDQVGVFTFTASMPAAPATYLGETVIGSNVFNTSANIGRFTPDHFDTLVTHGCTGGGNFTYSGQTFTVTAIARNQNNLAIVNYREGFSGVTLTDANPAATPLGSFNNDTIAGANFTSTGTGSGSISNISYTFTDKESIPETIEVRATDLNKTTTTTDDINSSGFTEGATEIRSGRARLENSFGSELVDMAVPAQIEFYNTNGFEINTADTCSVVTASLADIGTDDILVGSGSVSGQTCIWDDDGESGTDNCSDGSVLPGPLTSQFESPAVAGSFNLFLRAPGQNFTGDIGITLNTNASTWLQYDWDGDGSHDNDPTSVSSFGLYRGDDRIIYWREVFQ